ncbi:MAG: hypothetical protein OSA99_13740 [Acidimicrobiales bacterium]|nr:hypothetical protein [Acidimicrobiales bacterium]
MSIPGPGARVSMRGSIVSAGFASGDRVVVGNWMESPVGRITDVMWAEPSGRRVLFVSDGTAASFVAGVYEFDSVEVVPLRTVRGARSLTVTVGDRLLRFDARRGIAVPVPRPAWFTRCVEGPIARRLMGVTTHGVSPTGVEEWYRANRWAPLRHASAVVEGRSLGTMAPVTPACGFGFSEPPSAPSWVDVRPLLRYP